MVIKLKESQLINIIKKGHVLKEDKKDALTDFLTTWAGLKKDAENDTDLTLGKAFFDKIVMNPEFDFENMDLKDFETIDMWPINNTKINSPFGPRNIGGNATKFHKGVDLRARSGTPIYSPANGVVTKAYDDKGKCGGLIKIKHGEYETIYCHVRKWVVSKGQEVSKGQLIGYTGGGSRDPHKGNSMGPHLHYAVHINKRAVDPQKVHGRLS